MLRLQDKITGKDYSFYVMDAHHHLGEDEDGREVRPIGANNSYSFCKKVIFGDGEAEGIKKELKEYEDDYRWILPEKTFVEPHPLLKKFDPERLKRKELETYSIDQIVVFPMHDVFRDQGDILYQSSNDFIKKWINIPPHSRRLIGFGRIDPNENMEKNLNELKRMVQECNLKGLKLHPQSDDFDIGDDRVKKILKKTAELNIPVIFHTTYGSEVKKLHEMCNEIIAEFHGEDNYKFIPQLKVIIGHCTYQSEEVFNALSHPSMFGELSTLGNPKDYIKKLSENVCPERFFVESFPYLKKISDELTKKEVKEIFGLRVTVFEWHNKIMMGTDNPYMPVVKLIDLLKALFSQELDLNIGTIQNILSANLLRILPPQVRYPQKSSIKGDFDVLFQKDKELLEINPFVEPNIYGKVNTSSNIIKVKIKEAEEGENTIDMMHKKTSLTSLSEDQKNIEKDKLYALEYIKEEHPYLFEKTNPRIMPIDPEETASLASFHLSDLLSEINH